MQCVDAAERLLADEPRSSRSRAGRHVAECAACAHVAGGLRAAGRGPGLDADRRAAAGSAAAAGADCAGRGAARRRLPWWTAMLARTRRDRLADAAPQTVAVQGLAAIMLRAGELAGLRLALGLPASRRRRRVRDGAGRRSPAVAYLGGIPIDLQSLGMWSLVGIAGWLISENGLIGRRLAASGLRLP